MSVSWLCIDVDCAVADVSTASTLSKHAATTPEALALALGIPMLKHCCSTDLRRVACNEGMISTERSTLWRSSRCGIHQESIALTPGKHRPHARTASPSRQDSIDYDLPESTYAQMSSAHRTQLALHPTWSMHLRAQQARCNNAATCICLCPGHLDAGRLAAQLRHCAQIKSQKDQTSVLRFMK